jgi:hypothetical protein
MDDERDSSFVVWLPRRRWRRGTWNEGKQRKGGNGENLLWRVTMSCVVTVRRRRVAVVAGDGCGG